MRSLFAGYFGQLPGVEPRPYILRFTEDKPNPLYRKICYTFAWNAVINFVLLNLAGLAIAAVTGNWVMKQLSFKQPCHPDRSAAQWRDLLFYRIAGSHARSLATADIPQGLKPNFC